MTTQFRVLLTDRAWPDCEVEREILQSVGATIIEAPATDEATLIELAADADAIATCWAQVTRPVIQAAKKCKVVSRLGIGLDNIAVETASELGIPVTYVPDYCVEEVSDHALAFILASARNIGFFHHQTKQGSYNLQAARPMRRLKGMQVGLVGLGRISSMLFTKARALGFEVVAHTPSGNDHGTGCPMVSFPELLESSDFISIHAPLTDETRHLFGLPEFERMKSTAYLVNTSRGGLIDHAALWSALQDNQLAGAALDVFDPEPPDLSEPLFQDERVLITPHAGFVSVESLHDLRRRTAKQIADVLTGQIPEHVVNPHVYENRSN